MSRISRPPLVLRLVSCWKTFTAAAEPPRAGSTRPPHFGDSYRFVSNCPAGRADARPRLVAAVVVGAVVRAGLAGLAGLALARFRLAGSGVAAHAAAGADRQGSDHPELAVAVDRAVDLVDAVLELDRERRRLAGVDRLGRLLDAVPLDLDRVRRVAVVHEL